MRGFYFEKRLKGRYQSCWKEDFWLIEHKKTKFCERYSQRFCVLYGINGGNKMYISDKVIHDFVFPPVTV